MLGTGLMVTIAGLTQPAEGAISFNRDIRPILSDRCFVCHGPDAEARKANLRLDDFESATSVRRGVAAIVQGDPESSELLNRIRHSNPDERMPPPESKLALTEEDIALLERWIAQGATYETHWALVAPRRTTPETRAGEDAIDAFIRMQLEAESLSPSPPADRQTLIRRVTLDLTGLPPTIEEIDAFLDDDSAQAFERVVDRLLASEHYGERMAQDWLDVARYADTYGYQADVDRTVWPWRDWVIDAFNNNLPHDDFVTWQLAGDLLPNATREQRLATTFNRLHRQTNEGGSVEKEYRLEYVADRTQTFGTAFLGMTLECAKCHDHKYDPIAQRDFYRLSSFFDDIDESGLYSHFTSAVPTPALDLPTPEQERVLAQLQSAVEDREAELGPLRASRRASFQEWMLVSEAPITDVQAHYTFDALENESFANTLSDDTPAAAPPDTALATGRFGAAVVLDGDRAIRLKGVGAFNRTDPFTLSLWVKPPDHRERAVVMHRSRAWTDAASQGYELLLLGGRVSWSLIHFWPGDAISIVSDEPIPVDTWTHVVVTYDGSSRASGLAIYINGEPAPFRVQRDNLTRSITGGGPGDPAIGERFRDRGFAGGTVDELVVVSRSLSALEVGHLSQGSGPHEPLNLLGHNQDDLFEFYLGAHDPVWREELDALRNARLALARHVDSIQQIMTMRDMDSPRRTFVLHRGHYLSPAEQVHAGTPDSILPFGVRPTNRLGLANWLTDPSHPLLARIAVNRLWQVVFGAGLVPTMEDFGSQGTAPSHPELLDTLALDLIESGWDVKGMVRRLVLTSTYRQSSNPTRQLLVRDPLNTLLARGPSSRLSAEMMRDQALAASGLLVDRVGGPPAYPPQPMGLWKEKSGRTYPTGTGESRYRRSMYTFWKRTSPPPAMMIFDAAKRDVCIARRLPTSTPLQALVLLNDPQFVEAARVLAERIMSQTADDGERLTVAFRLLTARTPDAAERRAMLDLVDVERTEFATDPDAVDALLNIGEAPIAEDLDRTELAAWTIAISTLMSHDATVTKR